MAKRKRRDPYAKSLQDRKFRQRIGPTKKVSIEKQIRKELDREMQDEIRTRTRTISEEV